MATVPFVKMHGLGNDFVVVDARAGTPEIGPERARALADRRFGVGCDQVIVLEPSADPGADLFMRIRNPDGGEAEACGNATRCVADLIGRETGRDTVRIATRRGVLTATRAPGSDGSVAVDMGAPGLDWRDIPLAHAMDTLSLDIDIDGHSNPVAVSMGNPHVVFFVDDPAAVDLERLGPLIERHALFPARANVEFAHVRPDGSIGLRVWERGAGITLACGSGACATLVAAHRRGLTGRKAGVDLPGGRLTIDWRESDGHVVMAGPSARVFAGAFEA